MKKIITLLSILLISGCSFYTKHRGYLFPDDINTIVSKIETKADTKQKLGSPSAQTYIGKSAWIYYGFTENYNGPFPQTYSDKTALIIYFNNNDKIISKKLLHNDDFPNINIDSQKTEIPGAIDLNFFEELVGNIGRFTPNGISE